MSLSAENRALIERETGAFALRALDKSDGTYIGPTTINALLDAAREEGRQEATADAVQAWRIENGL